MADVRISVCENGQYITGPIRAAIIDEKKFGAGIWSDEGKRPSNRWTRGLQEQGNALLLIEDWNDDR